MGVISRTHRFSGPRALRFVYQNGRTVRGPNFAVRTILNPKRSSWRAAVVVSRKVHKSAVGRNRIRRRLYAEVRNLSSDILQPHDIVINVFSDSLLEIPANQLKKQIKQQLSQAGVLAKRVR